MDVQNNYKRGHNALYWTDPDGVWAIFENSSLENFFEDYIHKVQNKYYETSEVDVFQLF